MDTHTELYILCSSSSAAADNDDGGVDPLLFSLYRPPSLSLNVYVIALLISFCGMLDSPIFIRVQFSLKGIHLQSKNKITMHNK